MYQYGQKEPYDFRSSIFSLEVYDMIWTSLCELADSNDRRCYMVWHRNEWEYDYSENYQSQYDDGKDTMTGEIVDV